MDPRGKPYYWTAGDLPAGVAEGGRDIGVFAEGCVSVTPIQLDLTAYHAIPDLNAWEWETGNFQSLAASSRVEVLTTGFEGDQRRITQPVSARLLA
jgi:hypothetical protein